MKNKIKNYYIATIHECQGEYEHTTKYVFKTLGDPKAYNENTAKTWYGDDVEYCKFSGGYASGDVVTSAGEVRKISPADFKILKKHLSVL